MNMTVKEIVEQECKKHAEDMVEAKFKVLCKMLGKEKGFDVGEWWLDYSMCYGGYVIVEYGENGSEHHPLLKRRLKRSEMEAALDMTIALKIGV